MIEHTHVETPEELTEGATTLIRIDEGEFKNVVYRYGTLSFKEDGDECKVEFQFDISDPADFVQSELEKNIKFQTAIGDILIKSLEEFILNQEKETTNNE